MQLAFFLLPKSDSAYLLETITLRQAMEKMQHHGYSAVPVLNQAGQYLGTITVADFLWYIKDNHWLNLNEAEKVMLKDIPRRHDNVPVSIHANIRDLLQTAMEENFIPVIDDLGVFIGIVRRREIMEFYQSNSAYRSLEQDFRQRQADSEQEQEKGG